MTPFASDAPPDDVALDVAAVARLEVIPTLLRTVCEVAGVGFAAVARVTEQRWVACAVLDDIALGLSPGGELDVDTTLCKEVRAARTPVVIDHASLDPVYCKHHTPRTYRFESYISVPIVLPDGDYFGNLCALDPRPARVSDTRVVAMFSLFADLIGRQLAHERRVALQHSELLDARATAELREQFIAVLGHDLRDPLNVVKASAELLGRWNDPQLASIAQRLKRSAKRMSSLIDDVLDFARGRLGGGFAVDLAEVHDLGQALHDIVDEARAAHPDARIEASIESPEAVRCDRTRLQQLAANLLVNAVQHGAPAQPIAFSAKVSQHSVVITVTNQGTPIAPEHLAQVFSPYWRRGAAQRGQGLGLGLFICAEIARAHGGRIEVMSSAEHGTTFAAQLPIAGSARQR